ncbi:MAG TPA: metallophosphoesterase [Ignavibacteria bacterium]|nr:metallophosphoesterase [Ignavibacteria bacterium]HMR39987.1 metallophosphoesterase [Ignavibacteria bacterium]
MKKVISVIFIMFSFSVLRSQTVTEFAVIGDYGKSGTNELNVSNLVKSWNPEYVITLGDNNYESGQAATIDLNIGQYYHEFIYPYTGSYGAGDSVNRFFPSLGNHDWVTTNAQPYLDYFTLPGNERYYDFIKGNIHFFCIDSDSHEPDGRDSNSVQAQWLKAALAASASRYNIVYFHHPPYSSSSVHGSEVIMQWPFKDWGANLVMAGHDHTYERLVKDGLIYLVNGLGGKSIYAFGTPIPESVLRYNNNYGAMQVRSYHDSLVIKFITVTPSVRDYFIIQPEKKILDLTVLVEGMYDTLSASSISDTVSVYLRNSASPYDIIDSAKSKQNTSGNGILEFSNAANATSYYIVVKHRNSIETWSASGNSFLINNMSYDFTNSVSKAYGNNMVYRGTEYCIFSGDQNQDGVIDLDDVINISNDAGSFLSGYVNSDLNGDGIVELSDELLAYNNTSGFVIRIIP